MILRSITLILSALALTVNGCSCDEEPIEKVEQPYECSIGNCDSGDAYRNGQCVREGCESDQDCCPGTRCRSDLNMCWPFELEADFACESDADCDDPSMRCVETVVGERQPLRICRFDACEADEDCGRGQSCFSEVCVASVPCQVSCDSNSVCDVLTGWCTHIPEGAVGCEEGCREDEVMVLRDPVFMRGESCCAVECACAARPPIQPVRYGPYTRVAASNDKVWVATYEEAFGDLMVLQFDHDGNELTSEIVDGVPQDGQRLGDPDGPRGGIADPGPDVGQHIAMALSDAGLPRIAYYDATARALKMAVFDGTGWQVHQVQGPQAGNAEGAVGQHNAIAIDGSTGDLLLATHVSNLQQPDGRIVSGLRLARADQTAPSEAGVWSFTDLSVHWPVGACQGACGAEDACIVQGEGVACASVSQECGGCAAGEVCVGDGADGGVGLAFCAASAPDPVEGPVAAAGRYNQIYSDGFATVLGSHDGRFGALDLFSLYSDGTWDRETLDGNGFGAHPGHNVGRHLDVGRHQGQILVAFMDFTTHALRFWLGDPMVGNGQFGVIDAGENLDQPGLAFVGASAQLVASVTGTLSLVYQDATQLNLKMASFQNEEWTVRSLLSTGSHGFFSDIAVYGTKAFVVAMEEQLDDRGINQPYLWLLLEQVP